MVDVCLGSSAAVSIRGGAGLPAGLLHPPKNAAAHNIHKNSLAPAKCTLCLPSPHPNARFQCASITGLFDAGISGEQTQVENGLGNRKTSSI